MSDWRNKATSPAQAVKLLSSGTNIFLHGAAATPVPLIEAMSERQDLADCRLYHLHTEGAASVAAPRTSERLHSISMFSGPEMRVPIDEGRADFMPIFLSDVPALFSSGQVPLHAAIVQLSPPDAHGYCSLGTSIDTARAAVDNAEIVIAEINERMPRTHGATLFPFSEIDAFIHTNRGLPDHSPKLEGPVEGKIGELVAGLVEDGAALQMGIGAIPDAVLARLKNRSDLGVHTEMFSDGLIELVRCGAVTNKAKKVFPGVIVTSFAMGSNRLYDFINDNPLVQFLPCDKTNDTSVIRKNDRTTAINSAIQVDLTGQVCADSMGYKIYSGIGGQLDFIRGAALSKGGKPIIALPSTAAGGKVSRIVVELSQGAGVVTTRGHVHWVVTEYGAVNLHGKTLRQRAELLISIAHPDFRTELQHRAAGIRHFVF